MKSEITGDLQVELYVDGKQVAFTRDPNIWIEVLDRILNPPSYEGPQRETIRGKIEEPT